ncbi:MAG TPA: hypothetical protein VEK10_04350 [Steroidobacteraceae bacterium]|nr:hypothetical protein [Steroidobacteraceae bacterium]
MIDAIGLALLVGALISLCAYHLRRRNIAAFARRATQGSASEREAAFALGRMIFADVKRRGRDPILIPLLAALGASPSTILRKGGCCSGVHRLFIACLDSIGIRSAQITVFRRKDPAAAHCLVQVAADGTNILIDVDYGVWLRQPDGRPIDLLGLRSGLTPVIEPFVLDRKASYVDGQRSRPAGYPDREYYLFDYELTRTANWAETWMRRALYPLLHRLTAGRVDCLLLPPICEWPEVLVAAGLCTSALGLLVARALVL